MSKEKENPKGRLTRSKKDETAATYAEPTRHKGFTLPGNTLKWLAFAIILVTIAFIVSQTKGLMNFAIGNNSFEQKAAFVERLQEKEDLVTAEAYLKSVIEKEDYKTLFSDIKIPGTSRQILIIFPGKVQAGIDFSDISENDIEINEEEKTATLKVPKPKILGEPTLFMEQVQALSYEGLLSDKIDLSEAYDIAAEAQDLMLEEAKTQGLLDLAETNAEKVLQDMFQLVEYEVTIEFEE